MREQLRRYLESVKRFSGVVQVARWGEIVFTGAYGFADAARRIPNTMETRFCAGSVTKSMTALCIMRLVAEGRLSPADTVDKYFEEIYPGRGITLRHLLSHTSGMIEPFRLKEVTGNPRLSTMEIIQITARQDLLFSPGKKWRYSNADYYLMGKILEQVTGQDLHAYMREHILEPLGMSQTYFAGEGTEGLAQPLIPIFSTTPAMLYAAGDLISTAADLYRYDQALYGGELASKASIEEMQRPVHDGAFVKYGYGWFIKHLYRQRCVAHGGFDPNGYTAHLERYLDDRATVIVLSNQVHKYSPLGVKYFGATDVARELAARMYGSKARFWQKLF